MPLPRSTRPMFPVARSLLFAPLAAVLLQPIAAMAPGYLWIDDVAMERVGDDVPLTEQPILGPAGPAVKVIASFEEDNPFGGGEVVARHATDGEKSLRIDRSYVVMDAEQSWVGYDFLKADVFTEADEPVSMYVEARDKATTDYWTRVNYHTVIPPGRGTLVIPVQHLYVGEKSRPGRMLMLGDVTRLAFSIGENPPAPVYLDHVRLERDDAPRHVVFEGLHAFDLGTSSSPLMDGFTALTATTIYSRGRGYGLKDARIWRSYDVLQPDPLYQDFLCIESGGLAIDVPNGTYRVFVNMDNPSGFWGEYQAYRRRAILAEGKPVVVDEMDFDAFRNKYFRFWDTEDLPADDTFDKYQRAYYDEKTFDVEVTDGQLNLEFEGANWACSVSAVVIFPVSKAAEGERFLRFVEDRRRFYFDNYFKRVLRKPRGDPLAPTENDKARGYVVFRRDFMQDVGYHDTPRAGETTDRLAAAAFAGEYEPVTFTVLPLRDLGCVRVVVSDLVGPGGEIPAGAVDVGFVSYRLSRVTMEGTVYTIAPRLIMPSAVVDMPEGVARRFWLTVKTPADARPGVYRGSVAIVGAPGSSALAARLPIELTIRRGTLDAVDVPAGPWGHQIRIPWPGDEPEAAAWNDAATLASLHKIREYGFTSFSGVPTIEYRGFQDGKPVLDFTRADQQMKLARELGFLAVVAYGAGVRGINAYYQDTAAMKAAGMDDYSQFVRTIYTAVQEHADAAGWIPVYYNLGDEPIGDDLIRAAENAEAYTRAFPDGPPWFTAATSFRGSNADDPHFRFSKAVHVANWNLHDEASVNLIRKAGRGWAFYNRGSRWMFGDYMYKAVHEFDMKFRLTWHWNATAGDPYYALDCREDDYAWCNATPDGRLVPSVEFERLREGLDDYRRLLTLARLAREKQGNPAAAAAERLIAERMASFTLGQCDHDALFVPGDWTAFRAKVDAAIEALR